ncbi:stage V sporulation protein S [Desulfofundulus thermosubterraneus]|uniref:Stage V sporulation protein S (SpoVS) n=1 Tax=Desulfofundulus thermosubterraneus DSM 16057 TaxID=1121432 RepID=A0A1M6JG12_9FIRM|nr:stage V sporulation protein S [Desulfofundulus thermosubterraneus]SHJ45627.1 Stage V sporulation protein S (SpoVS) [Desulfofundulus thermosubterraneus DSM 16057]
MPRVKLKGREPVRFRPYFMAPPAPSNGGAQRKNQSDEARPPLVFHTRVASASDPEKVAGSIAKALAEGHGVEVRATGEAALARLLLALGLAQAFTRKNGGAALVEVDEVDLDGDSVRVSVSGRWHSRNKRGDL